jgi:hypothetical protein
MKRSSVGCRATRRSEWKDAEPAVVTLRLVGRLGGPEARELARARNAVGLTQPHQTVLFDLTGLTGVDIVGKELLAQAHRNGGRLVGGATSRAIVDEIIAGSGIENGPTVKQERVRDGLSGRVHAVFGS